MRRLRLLGNLTAVKVASLMRCLGYLGVEEELGSQTPC